MREPKDPGLFNGLLQNRASTTWVFEVAMTLLFMGFPMLTNAHVSAIDVKGFYDSEQI